MLEKKADFTIYKNEYFDYYFSNNMYFFKYNGIIRGLILNYKFEEKSYLYKTFTNFMIKNKKFCEILKTYDIIIPVPISKKRKKERGYNQSLLIASELSKFSSVELVTNCLLKQKNTEKQSKLNKFDRRKNIEGAYKVLHPEKLEHKKILLVDDIFTTGSTVNECCKTLYTVDIKYVDVLTIAKD